MGTTFTVAEVAAFEHETWSRCAPTYAAGFGRLTAAAVEPLLDRADVGDGTRLLDVGVGTGVAAAAALSRGAHVCGVDFSEAMLTEARQRVPAAGLRLGSADDLPYEDDRFDAIVANCVLHHLARPEDALREAHRVLTPGGRVAATVWGPIESLEAFGLFFAAVEDVLGAAELPHGPLFGVTDEDRLGALFGDAGFSRIRIELLPTRWSMDGIDTLLHALGTWAQLDAVPSDARAGIERDVREAAAERYGTGPVSIPNPMLLVSAVASA